MLALKLIQQDATPINCFYCLPETSLILLNEIDKWSSCIGTERAAIAVIL